MRTPVCYFSAHDQESRRIVLLLEDLGGARFGDAASEWSQRDAESVVDALAGLRARWWNDQKLAQWTWLPPYGDVEAQMEKSRNRRPYSLSATGKRSHTAFDTSLHVWDLSMQNDCIS